jgi:magnesium-protoporphyrin O-methyltransferase
MSCSCHCTAAASHFDARRAQRDRARYERNGPDNTTALLLQELRPVANPGDRLLDVGGGIGVLGVELRSAGLSEVILVDAAAGSLAVAAELMAGSSPATTFRAIAGDFTEVAPLTGEIVTLDRVVCCYPDFDGLLRRAASSARRVLALSFPRDRWYVSLVLGIENLWRRIVGDPFRTFVHPPPAMAALLRDAGWTLETRRTTLAWCVERWGRRED